ncbi:uncharacterized protein LOC134197493 [Corticium candelabrum]|uniref:uncharacterized protein LOC134197493 n=1 Tax=Corticium candelabrum TaxID=121492 RepID=UPI002E259A53|nr:uncharacterized protein LOC134197493 [Corticium candelabrum]
MGVSSSAPRRVTIERGNEDIGVVKITQSALKQLMETDPIHDGENEGRTEGDDGEVGMSRNVTGEQQAGHVVDEKSRGSSVDWQMLESFHEWKSNNQKEMMEDFKRQEAQYEEHFNHIEQLLSESQRKAEHEATNSANIVIGKLRKPRRSILVEHAGLTSQLANCLEQNRTQPLLCSKLAKEFITVAFEAQKEVKTETTVR